MQAARKQFLYEEEIVMGEQKFCRYCGKPLVNGECTCAQFQAHKQKMMAGQNPVQNQNYVQQENAAQTAQQAETGFENFRESAAKAFQKASGNEPESLEDANAYERNVPIIPDCIQPEEGETLIRQYNIAILRTRLKFMKAEGRLAVTNRRVLFRAAGRCLKGPVLQEHEFKIDEIGGIEIHDDYKFSTMNFVLFLLLEILIMIPVISASIESAMESWMYGRSGADTAAGVILILLGIAAAAGSVYIRRKSLLSDLLAMAATFCVTFGNTRISSGFTGFLCVISWIFLVVMLLINSMVPNLVIKIKTRDAKGAVVIGSQKAICQRKTGDDYSGYAEVLPWKDTKKAINELGTLINDLQQHGDDAVQKWTR